jgi:hypothetical protein
MALTALQRQEIRRKFPSFAYLLDEPELANLFAQAVEKGWGPGEFQSQLMATRWWKTHSETARNWDTVVATDPAEARRQIGARQIEIANEVRRLGMKLTTNQIGFLATVSLREGWDPTIITRRIIEVGREAGLAPSGEIRANAQDLKALAKQYAVAVSQSTLNNWAMEMAQGRMTEEGIRAQFVDMAKRRIDPQGENLTLQRALDSGFTVREVYQGVIETVARELEIDQSGIDLTSGHWGKLLDYEDPNGKMRPMTVTEATKWARGQGSWQQTNTAKEAYTGLADAMTSKWGLRK